MKLFFENNEDAGPSIIIKAFNHSFGFCLCHRREDRCIKYFGLENVMCSRCFGIWFGFLVGTILFTLNFLIPIQLSILMIFPMLFDGFSQNLGFRESNNLIRLFTGTLFGIGFASTLFLVIIQRPLIFFG